MIYAIYLLHFDQPVGVRLHYIGSARTDQLERRLRNHANGIGARLPRLAMEQGSGFTLSRLWMATSRDPERLLKENGHFKRHCPICTPSIGVEPPGQYFRTVLTRHGKSDFRALGF